jgi:hypothetical protein
MYIYLTGNWEWKFVLSNSNQKSFQEGGKSAAFYKRIQEQEVSNLIMSKQVFEKENEIHRKRDHGVK